MKLRFTHKSFMQRPNVVIVKSNNGQPSVVKQKQDNKRGKKNNTAMTNEQFEAAERVMDTLEPEVKVVKKDRGLIERTESSKIVLTEDNRQVLND